MEPTTSYVQADSNYVPTPHRQLNSRKFVRERGDTGVRTSFSVSSQLDKINVFGNVYTTRGWTSPSSSAGSKCFSVPEWRRPEVSSHYSVEFGEGSSAVFKRNMHSFTGTKYSSPRLQGSNSDERTNSNGDDNKEKQTAEYRQSMAGGVATPLSITPMHISDIADAAHGASTHASCSRSSIPASASFSRQRLQQPLTRLQQLQQQQEELCIPPESEDLQHNNGSERSKPSIENGSPQRNSLPYKTGTHPSSCSSASCLHVSSSFSPSYVSTSSKSYVSSSCSSPSSYSPCSLLPSFAYMRRPLELYQPPVYSPVHKKVYPAFLFTCQTASAPNDACSDDPWKALTLQNTRRPPALPPPGAVYRAALCSTAPLQRPRSKRCTHSASSATAELTRRGQAVTAEAVAIATEKAAAIGTERAAAKATGEVAAIGTEEAAAGKGIPERHHREGLRGTETRLERWPFIRGDVPAAASDYSGVGSSTVSTACCTSFCEEKHETGFCRQCTETQAGSFDGVQDKKSAELLQQRGQQYALYTLPGDDGETHHHPNSIDSGSTAHETDKQCCKRHEDGRSSTPSPFDVSTPVSPRRYASSCQLHQQISPYKRCDHRLDKHEGQEHEHQHQQTAFFRSDGGVYIAEAARCRRQTEDSCSRSVRLSKTATQLRAFLNPFHYLHVEQPIQTHQQHIACSCRHTTTSFQQQMPPLSYIRSPMGWRVLPGVSPRFLQSISGVCTVIATVLLLSLICLLLPRTADVHREPPSLFEQQQKQHTQHAVYLQKTLKGLSPSPIADPNTLRATAGAGGTDSTPSPAAEELAAPTGKSATDSTTPQETAAAPVLGERNMRLSTAAAAPPLSLSASVPALQPLHLISPAPLPTQASQQLGVQGTSLKFVGGTSICTDRTYKSNTLRLAHEQPFFSLFSETNGIPSFEGSDVTAAGNSLYVETPADPTSDWEAVTVDALTGHLYVVRELYEHERNASNTSGRLPVKATISAESSAGEAAPTVALPSTAAVATGHRAAVSPPDPPQTVGPMTQETAAAAATSPAAAASVVKEASAEGTNAASALKTAAGKTSAPHAVTRQGPPLSTTIATKHSSVATAGLTNKAVAASKTASSGDHATGVPPHSNEVPTSDGGAETEGAVPASIAKGAAEENTPRKVLSPPALDTHAAPIVRVARDLAAPAPCSKEGVAEELSEAAAPPFDKPMCHSSKIAETAARNTSSNTEAAGFSMQATTQSTEETSPAAELPDSRGRAAPMAGAAMGRELAAADLASANSTAMRPTFMRSTASTGPAATLGTSVLLAATPKGRRETKGESKKAQTLSGGAGLQKEAVRRTTTTPEDDAALQQETALRSGEEEEKAEYDESNEGWWSRLWHRIFHPRTSRSKQDSYSAASHSPGRSEEEGSTTAAPGAPADTPLTGPLPAATTSTGGSAEGSTVPGKDHGKPKAHAKRRNRKRAEVTSKHIMSVPHGAHTHQSVDHTTGGHHVSRKDSHAVANPHTTDPSRYKRNQKNVHQWPSTSNSGAGEEDSHRDKIHVKKKHRGTSSLSSRQVPPAGGAGSEPGIAHTKATAGRHVDGSRSQSEAAESAGAVAAATERAGDTAEEATETFGSSSAEEPSKLHYHAIVQQIQMQPDGRYIITESCRTAALNRLRRGVVLDFFSEKMFTESNKGFEGIASFRDRKGTLYLLGLCEGNYCRGGTRGQRRDCPAKVLNMPREIYFRDYSAVALHGMRIAVTSQEDSVMWLGELGNVEEEGEAASATVPGGDPTAGPHTLESKRTLAEHTRNDAVLAAGASGDTVLSPETTTKDTVNTRNKDVQSSVSEPHRVVASVDEAVVKHCNKSDPPRQAGAQDHPTDAAETEVEAAEEEAELHRRRGPVLQVDDVTKLEVKPVIVAHLNSFFPDPECMPAGTVGGRILYFPRDPDCNVTYCNIEGIAFITDTLLAAASDKVKAYQDNRCIAKEQSLHIFVVPPQRKKRATASGKGP